MNRSVLLVICDFLILTLLSFVRFDSAEPPVVGTPAATQELSVPAMSNMVATLEQALEAERQRREVLTNALAAQSAELTERLRLLTENEARMTNLQRQLSESESEARRLAQERARLEQSRSEALSSVQALNKAFEVTQRSTENLQEKLTDTTREAAEAAARLRAVEEELARRREEAEEMKRRLSQLDDSREALSEQKNQLLVELRQTEVEARMARGQVTNLSVQLATSAQEKSQLLQTASHLATNFGALSTNFGALSQQSVALKQQVERQAERQAEQAAAIREDIQKQTRLAANTIYGDFISNRVFLGMTGTTRGAFGQEVVRRREGGTVFVRAGGRVFAILHVDSTPLRIWPPEASWTGFSAALRHDNSTARAAEFALLRRDPRVVVVPVDPSLPASLKVKVYDVATDASAFADAVVIGGEEAYYGESNFRLTPETPGYVEMQRSSFRRLFGEFAPRRGDLAFTRTGQFLGILVNGDRCLLLEDLETLPAFRCAEGLDASANSAILKRAQSTLERLPSALK